MYAGKLLNLVLVVLLTSFMGCSTIDRRTHTEPGEGTVEKVPGNKGVVWQREAKESGVGDSCDTAPKTGCPSVICTKCGEAHTGYQQRMEAGINCGLANLVWGPLEIIGQPLAYAVEGHGDDVELSSVFLAPADILCAPFINENCEEPEGLGIVGFIGGVPVGVHKGVMRVLYGAGTLPSAPFGVYIPWDDYWKHKRHANFVGIGNILYSPFEVVAQPFTYATEDGTEFVQFVRFVEGIPVGVAAGCVRITYGVSSLIMSPFDSSIIPPLDKMLKWTGRKGPDFLLPQCKSDCTNDCDKCRE